MPRKVVRKERGVFEKVPGSDICRLRHLVDTFQRRWCRASGKGGAPRRRNQALQDSQGGQQEQALANCFREEWNGAGAKAKRILLPVRHLQQWIEHNVLLLLKQAPFNKRDPSRQAQGVCRSHSNRRH